MTNVQNILGVKSHKNTMSFPRKSVEQTEDYATKKVVLSQEITLSDGTSAGFVKNDANGVLSGGNAGASTVEGEDVLSTGIDSGSYLGADGDGTSSWKSVAGGSGITDHTELTSIGSNTHDQIDTHIADVDTNPHAVKLNEIENPDGDGVINMNTQTMEFRWANPNGNAMEFTASGAYSDSVLHVHQHTGNPGAGTYLMTFESEDTDVEHIKSIAPLSTTHVLCNYVGVEATEEFILSANGLMEWGNGTDAQDVNLYRDSANLLKTDDALYVVGNITTDGTVDGIDVGTDVAANTVHITSDGTDHSDVVANTLASGSNTALAHTQNTDTILGSGCVAVDHGAAGSDQVVNVSYGTGSDAPTASTTTEGSLYVQYTA